MNDFQFHLPVQIRFGVGRIQELQSILGEQFKNILIVTDKGVAEKSRALEAILPQLQDYNVTLFNQVEQNPSFKTLEKGREVAKRDDVQVIIGLGGGSPMDAAKGIAVLATNEEEMPVYMSGTPLMADPLPIICIATTAGTGSEVMPVAVFTDIENQVKQRFVHPQIFPAVSIVDPELTQTMPKKVIVDSALMALVQAVEGYLSKDAQPLTDAMALKAIARVIDSLTKAMKHDLGEATHLAYAAMLSGMVATHANTLLLDMMGYPLTLGHRLPHGRACGLLLPAFLNFMREKSSVKERVGDIERCFASVDGVEAWLTAVGHTPHLAEHGVPEDVLAGYAAAVMAHENVTNIAADLSEKDVLSIYKAAF